ncbi:MAG: FHA domain-containing protein [Bacteroidales bacterium]|nr:FHA domain-containing protein [Bacteroidales bacterium]
MEKITVKLKCPKCGKNLSAQINPGVNIANAKIRCSDSLCRYLGKGAEFLPGGSAQHGSQNSGATMSNADDTEELGTQTYQKSFNIATDMGQIRTIADGRVFPLHLGINSVGRMAATYKQGMEPDTKIKTNDMKMSRCHARIDVKRSSMGSGYVFHLQDTSLNGIDLYNKEIPKNAVIILSFGDQMVWGDTKVIFEAANGTQTGGDDTLRS